MFLAGFVHFVGAAQPSYCPRQPMHSPLSELLHDLESCDNNPVAVARCFVDRVSGTWMTSLGDVLVAHCTMVLHGGAEKLRVDTEASCHDGRGPPTSHG